MSNSNERVKAATAAGAVLATLLAGWVAHEGFSSPPYVPVKGDVPTIGFGATYYEDGRRVTMQDAPITRERALELASWHLSSQYMKCVVVSLGETPVLPKELELAVDHAGQYGCAAWQSSPMLKAYKRGDYEGACKGYLSYKFMTADKPLGRGWVAYRTPAGKTRYRYDCSTPGSRQCSGVWKRSVTRFESCTEAVESVAPVALLQDFGSPVAPPVSADLIPATFSPAPAAPAAAPAMTPEEAVEKLPDLDLKLVVLSIVGIFMALAVMYSISKKENT